MRIINIEQGHPVVDHALFVLGQGLHLAKSRREKAVKIIHGYGSSGKGGSIKLGTMEFLEKRKKAGLIKDYCRGEEFTPNFEQGRKMVQALPRLKDDADYGRQNDGITIVIL